MERENRIFYDVEDGVILWMTGESFGDVVPHKESQSVGYVDVPYGSIDHTKKRIVAIDPETKEVITETMDFRSPEQKKIDELEEHLLLLAGVI